MDQITSPDLPAWFCYLLVLSLGMLVARANVNRLLASQPGHWGFVNTWVLFSAHAVMPVVLFWFLDYTSALRDTALFGALLVAFGYRQIFAGGIQGITMPGQTPRLWQPFEAWVSRIKEQIATQYQDSRSLFDAKVRVYLASDTARMERLRGLSFTYTSNPEALSEQLTKLASQKAPDGAPAQSIQQWKNNEEARILLNDLRRSQPVNYGIFLYQDRLITSWMYHNWRQSRQSQWAGWVGAALIILTIGFGALKCYRSERVTTSYYQWRLTKAGVSDYDRFRSREHLASRLEAAVHATPPDAQRVAALVSPLIARLRFRDTSPQTADDVLALFIDTHSPGADRVVIPGLIEALRNPNEDLRLRVRRAISGLQQADFPNNVPDDVADKWVPAKNENPMDIDRHVQAWQAWWRGVQAAPPAPLP
jgi:hypothetical protein